MRHLLALLILLPSFCFAEEVEKVEEGNKPEQLDEIEVISDVPELPEMPNQIKNNEDMEADITIIRKDEATIQEFRKNGILYKVKVIPDIGLPYYLMNNGNENNMDVHNSDLDKEQNIHQWKLWGW